MAHDSIVDLHISAQVALSIAGHDPESVFVTVVLVVVHLGHSGHVVAVLR